MHEECPICHSFAEIIGSSDYGERRKQRCTRCGLFEITRTALAMLSSRVAEDKNSVARLSHAIRTNTSDEDPLFISSANLDELIGKPLPDPSQQVKLLLLWLSGELKDNTFGRVPMQWPESLTGIVGALGSDQVERLLIYAAEQGMIELDRSADSIGLTPKGWALLNISSNLPEERETTMQPTLVRAHCNACGGKRDSFRRSSTTISGTDGEVHWSDTYEVLECCGCHSSAVRHTKWLSEWDTFGHDPISGKEILVRGEEVNFWPPLSMRKKPHWVNSLDDRILRNVFDEIYSALSSNLLILASIGTRTALDRGMFLRVGDPAGGFSKKLDLMFEKGHIGADEKETLKAITDAGSAAAHRGFSPNLETFETILEVTENFLYRAFVLKSAAGNVHKVTPPRSK